LKILFEANTSLYELEYMLMSDNLERAEFIHYFELLKSTAYHAAVEINFWPLIHPKIKGVSEPRFRDMHYKDSVFTAFIEVEDRVRTIVKNKTGEDFSGSQLMMKAFSPNNPIIKLDDLTTQTGIDLQRGYMEIYTGAMLAIRNPKAHRNFKISKENAIHLLFIASTLMYNLENKFESSENS
jgi:uncharacterized protein (TIGR02391 family)